MNKSSLLGLIFLISSMMVISGCGNNPTPETVKNIATSTPVPTNTPLPSPTITITNTPDLCASGNVETIAEKVHSHMREFDDASILAANMPREQLSGPVANLQKIRREAEDEQIPPCLAALKNYQINHMNAVINTLIAFMGGAKQQDLDQGISAARQLHDQYTLELARILGLTVVPATAIVTPQQTPTP
jgi:hypothetical protein